MRILLLEDDEATALRVLGALKARGHMLQWGDEQHLLPGNGESLNHEVVIIGQQARDADAFARNAARIALLRRHRPALAVILLCGSGQSDDRVAGLQAGADDCLPRDFNPEELAASIEALMRRRTAAAAPATQPPVTLRVNDIAMDLLRREVTRAGRLIALMPQEFRILECLLRHRDRVVSKTMLLGALERGEEGNHVSLIETQISRLRAKLNRETGMDAIETVRGAGYRIRIEA